MKNVNILFPGCGTWSFLPCLQNPLLCLIIGQINPVHIFITSFFTITCNHLILLICWNILNSHFKFDNLKRHVLTVPCISALNKILSMPGLKILLPSVSNCIFLCFPYHPSLLHSHHLVQTAKLWIMLFHPHFSSGPTFSSHYYSMPSIYYP